MDQIDLEMGADAGREARKKPANGQDLATTPAPNPVARLRALVAASRQKEGML